MSTITKEIQDGISPDRAIEMLKEGNQRFLNKNETERDLHLQVNTYPRNLDPLKTSKSYPLFFLLQPLFPSLFPSIIRHRMRYLDP